MITCSKCKNAAVILIRYNGLHLCKEHFVRYIENRVKKEIRKQINIRKNERIAVALSGGKDSSVTLYLLHKIFSERRFFSLSAITIDEGIDGYREKTIVSAKKLCKSLQVEHHIIQFKDNFKYSLDQLMKIYLENTDFAPCTFCGVFRRYCINKKAYELKITHLATGLNLDDTVQSILMNIFRGDIDKLARMGPHSYVQNGLVPRIQPLRIISENEILLYAILVGIPFDHSECPYSSYAARNKIRELVNSLEDNTPGTKYAILNGSDKIVESFSHRSHPYKISKCMRCNEPTGQKICKACTLLEKIKLDSKKGVLYNVNLYYE